MTPAGSQERRLPRSGRRDEHGTIVVATAAFIPDKA
jgi:hypothetical protein